MLLVQALQGQTRCCCCSGKSDFEPNPTGELINTPVDTNSYFNKDWLPADIVLAYERSLKNIKVKYNMLIDELLYKEPNSGKIVKLDKKPILRFHFLNYQGDTSLYFDKIRVKKDLVTDSADIFAQRIFTGKLSLLIFHNYFFERSELVSTGNGSFQRDIFTEKPVYYFKYINNKTVGLKRLNRKSIYKLFPAKRGQIKQFFKQTGHSKITTSPEIIILMRFLNSIEEL